MDIDRETIVEAAGATIPVLVAIALFMYIGTAFSAEDLTPTGGQALVGAIVVFVFLMFGIGLYLSWNRSDGDGGGANPNGS